MSNPHSTGETGHKLTSGLTELEASCLKSHRVPVAIGSVFKANSPYHANGEFDIPRGTNEQRPEPPSEEASYVLHLSDLWGVKYSLLNPLKSLPKMTGDSGDRAAAGENR